MAQTGYTPISFYYSSTSSNIPSAGNLVDGEIAINTADGVIYYKNSGGSVVPLSFGSTGISWQSVQTANFTAVAGNGYPVNTTSGAITVTLPASPTAGQLVTFTDYTGTFATNNLTINPNGNNLLGASNSVLMATNNESLSFVYIDSTQGWLPYDGYNSSIPASAAYLIQNSLRFRSANSAYLNRTPASASNRQTWTYSAWVKRGKLAFPSNDSYLLSAGVDNNNRLLFRFSGASSSNILDVYELTGGTGSLYLASNATYIDPAAWYHVMLVYDTTNATAANRVKIYVNGSQISYAAGPTYPPQNYSSYMNSANRTTIAINAGFNDQFFDGYMAEINFIDGQALTPTSFGKTDASTGSWIPVKYTGTYGTNGFYLPFTNKTSTATLGNDFSGNGNTWTVNNVSLTAGSTYDSMNDVPTLTSATASNFCTWNPLVSAGGNVVCVNGNLQAQVNSFGNVALGTIGVTSGKWYWELTPTYTSNTVSYWIGVAGQGYSLGSQPDSDAKQWGYYSSTGNKGNASYTSYGSSYTTGDVIGMALDMDAGTLVFYKNGVSQGTAFTNLAGNTIFPMYNYGNTGTSYAVLNCGQQPFVYTPPTGYVALNTFNL